MSKLRERQTAERKRRILEAAAALFAERGYSATNVEDIAARAAVGVSTIYKYFGVKGGLIRDLWRPEIDRLREAGDRLLAAPPEDPARAVADLVGLYRFGEDWKQRDLFLALAGFNLGYAEVFEGLRERFDALVLEQLERLIRRFQRQGRMPRGLRARDAAMVVYSVMNHHLQLWATREDLPLARAGICAAASCCFSSPGRCSTAAHRRRAHGARAAAPGLERFSLPARAIRLNFVQPHRRRRCYSRRGTAVGRCARGHLRGATVGRSGFRCARRGALSRAACALACIAGAGVDGLALAAIEEVVVTARRREEGLQETPLAVTAFTPGQLAARNIDRLDQISRFTPNLIFDAGSGNTGGSANGQVFIRGIGQTDFLFASDPGVGLYVDEVYFPRATGVVLDLVDVERVEVLRGPQGTLFGKNTIGGALNIVSRAPGEKLGAEVTVTAGSRDRIDARGAADVPLVQDLLHARVSFSTRHQDGYVRRLTPDGRDEGDTDSSAIRGQLRFTPGGDWIITFAGDVTRKREHALAQEVVAVHPSTPADPALFLWNMLVAPGLGPGVAYDARWLTPDYTNASTGPNMSDFDMWGVSLVATGTLAGSLRLKSVTAWREQDAEFGQDQDGSPLRYTETTNENAHEGASQELQLAGDGFGDRLSWVAGVFYMHEEGDDRFDTALAAGLFDALEALPAPLVPLAPGVACPPPPGVPLPCAGGTGNPLNVGLDFEATFVDAIDIDSYAAYGQGTFALTERLSLSAGLRYTYERKEFTTELKRNAAGVTTLPETTIENDWDAFTPRLGLEYRFTPALMTYLSAARGFKSGGFNGRAQTLEEIDTFDPEFVWSYEVGLKSEWFGRRLVVNLAAFHTDYSDIQILTLRPVSGGILAAVTENAGDADIDGVEIEIAAQPVPGLDLRGTLGWIDAAYTGLAPNATVGPGDDFVKTPKWNASLAGQYRIPLAALGAVMLGADVSYRSRYVNESNNTPVLVQDPVALVGARISWTSSDDRWEAALSGTNLSDERYVINGLTGFGSLGLANATFGRPREWALSLRVRF